MKTIQLDKAALERMVEDRVRTLHDTARSGAPAPAANFRPTEQNGSTTEDERASNSGTAWRGSQNPAFGHRTQMDPKVARSVMQFFQGVSLGDRDLVRAAHKGLGTPVERLQQVGVQADGGYTIPEQFSSEVVAVLPSMTPFADKNLVRIVPMELETLRWTKVATKPAQPAYTAEGAAYSTTGVTFSTITLVAKKLGEIIPLTEEIMQSNQIEMVQVISELVAEVFAYKRNALVTSGAGGATAPEGVLTNGNIASTAWVSTSDQTKSDSLISTFHALKSQYRRDAIWLMHDSIIALVRKLKDTQGRYLWTDGFGPNPPTIMGRPVFENPDIPINLGAGSNESVILFGNFRRGYVIGSKKGMEVDRNSSGTDWTKDIVNYKFRERWDGRVNDESAFVKATAVK